MCSRVGRDLRAVPPVAAAGAQARGTAGVRAARARCMYSFDGTALLCIAKQTRVGPAVLTLAIMASFCFIQSCLPSEPVTSRVARGDSICRSRRECARYLSEASSPSKALATAQSVSTSGVAPVNLRCGTSVWHPSTSGVAHHPPKVLPVLGLRHHVRPFHAAKRHGCLLWPLEFWLLLSLLSAELGCLGT